jgi:hypothetical protein
MDISIAGSKFVVADYRNNRVLLFNAIPTAVDAAADFVLGQANFTGTSANRGAAVAANTLNLPGSVWTDGARIAVADSANNRVLLWNAWPTASGAPADIVLGQLDFAGAAINRGSPTTIANGMYEPSIVRFVDGKLYVADRFNNRILVWNDWPTANGQIPDRYLLQDDATSSLYGRGESGFSDINFFEIVGDALFVTDRLNFRYVGMPMPQ